MNGQPHDESPPRPPRAERLLQISLAALTSLGTMLLGMGERNVTLPVLAVIVAVSSVYMTDVKGWLQLNTFVANVAGVIALAVTWRDWNNYASEGQLLSLANLLIYLQFVLLYRQKSLRTYWLLLLLSLLQVAVAAALNMSVSFGLLLPAYMFVGLVTMALFVVYREQTEHDDGPAPTPWRVPSDSGGAEAAASRRGPLVAFQARQPAGAADSGLGYVFFRQMLWLGAATFLFSLIWFFGLPRAGKKGPWRPAGVMPYTSVGFSETVTLGQLGEVYENPEEVMQVTFRDYETKEAYRVGGDSALFRGSVLYEYDRGRWKPLHPLRPQPTGLPRISDKDMSEDEHWVREEITIRGRSDDMLFTVLPVFSMEQFGLLYSPETERLQRPRSKDGSRKFEYKLLTTAFRDHIPQMAMPAERRPDAAALKMPGRRRGIDPMAKLRAIAARIAGETASGRREQIARALESRLRDSGEFQYSLKPAPRTPGVDLVEDFVSSNKSGHCEYFASALTLMLRSVGIPARLAIGFKGGEWNPLQRFYQIRELHAHAWVEAYVGPENLPAGLSNNAKALRNGAWLVLDPTPSRPREDDLAGVFGLGGIKRLLDLSQLVWTNYVLGMDAQRQQEAIYQPLMERLESSLRSLADGEGRQRIGAWLARLFGGRTDVSQGFFSRRGFLATMVSLLLASLFWGKAKTLAGRFRDWSALRPAATRRAARRVEFYEEFEALLGRYGMPRTGNQTQREFALAASGHLAESPLTRQAALLPGTIADAFYCVRFGARQLDNTELQSVERATSELAAALAARQAEGRLALDASLHAQRDRR